MLKRKITDRLVAWKAAHGQECLLINGARQVGKSFAIADFGRNHYKSYIEIDFVKNPGYKDIFKESLSSEDVYSRLTLFMPGIELIENDTLIFLDEIQECPEARAAFKYLAQNGRFDVIGSGSLLGTRFREMANAPSLPVGYERQITMHSLDFEEFLWANGYDDQAISMLRGYFDRLEPVPQGVHQAMMRLLREYMAVGGMPAVVQAFLPAKDFGVAHAVQMMLHELYLDDIAKYAKPTERIKARACYLSLPRQLAKENTRFRYAAVEKRGTSRKFENSIDWLTEAHMVQRCQAVSLPSFPLVSYEDQDRFRLYANDLGLLMAMFDFSMKAAVVDNTLKGPMKGGLYENLVASMLVANGVPLHYWMSSDSKNEVEFIVDSEGSACPVEVKASRGSTASLDALLAKYEVGKGYKLIDGNVGIFDKKVTLPLYMAMFLFS